MNLSSLAARVGRILAREGMRALTEGRSTTQSSTHRVRASSRRTARPGGRRPAGRTAPQPSRTGGRRDYLGDWRSPLPTRPAYHPRADGRPDAGEVVWAWVPYEEDATQGKDRPVLVLAAHPSLEDAVLAAPLTSKDHDRDAAQEARAGRHWMDVGSGAWDDSARSSEVRLDRVLQLRAGEVRREGSALAEDVFAAVYAACSRARH